MSSQTPIATLTPGLQIQLKEHTEGLLSNIINTNLQTRFVQEFDGLRKFRDAIELLKPRSAHEAWECYRDSVPLTNYDTYEPFISRFLADPCREEDVKDLLSPGLPFYIAKSSGTSGKAAKLFPKYHRHLIGAAPGRNIFTAKTCHILSLTYLRAIDVLRNEGKATKVIVTSSSSGRVRMHYDLCVEKDPEMIKMTLPNTTSPIAVSHIRNYRSYLLMHALFALAEEKLTGFRAVFGTLFLDLIVFMEEEWPTLLNGIENGTIPDFEDMHHVREYLEPKLLPNPSRAQKLREIGESKADPGWLFRIWPELQQVACIVTGVFATTLPKLRHYLGPEVLINSGGIGASEASIGVSYSFTDLNLFKVTSEEFIEYLNITKDPSPVNLVPAWELETGHRYEIFLTTRNGLWRYCLGDIIEVAGFDPNDGSPLLRYVERSNRELRLGVVSITETQIIEGILAGEKSLGKINEFTVIIDERTSLRRLGYFVELHDALNFNISRLEPNAHLALHEIHDELRRINYNVNVNFSNKVIGEPTIRILKPGTFREYRQWRLGIARTAAGQTKVPVFVMDEATKEWLKERVMHELLCPAED
ncbi:GH3 auxin-responsive promoter [Hygrophoropsis aurantiaca]|uniref:GH3 auxin-responsive promoter n=1 Tax=Hygrophoropsis aurantiaca TaxID=72124 RepID=A0ACB7ZTG6_9AGAM|nr:GH3 auxin-responsive promoter [Hygrophoropsis aurantiaca]